ncbi:MAG: hypothetical protein WCP09_00555 [Candidatus Taylorbacteria bacterium]
MRMEFDYKVLEEKFKLAPDSVKELLTSSKITNDIERIADKNGLLLDQLSTLNDIVSYVLLGLVPAKDFVTQLSKEANVSVEIANKIATDINNDVLKDIRDTMKDLSNEADKKISAANDLATLEKAGGFTIEKDQTRDGGPSDDTNGIGSGNQAETTVSYRDKAQILSDIENPTPSKESTLNKDTAEVMVGPHTEPLVDYLLSSPTGSKIETVTTIVSAPKPTKPIENTAMKAPIQQQTPPVPIPEAPPKPKSPDLYREPVK